jgi:hypothetical protein
MMEADMLLKTQAWMEVKAGVLFKRLQTTTIPLDSRSLVFLWALLVQNILRVLVALAPPILSCVGFSSDNRKPSLEFSSELVCIHELVHSRITVITIT